MVKLFKNVYSGFTNILNYPLKKRYIRGALNIINFHQVSDTFDHAYHHKGTFAKFTIFKDLVTKINNRYGIISLQVTTIDSTEPEQKWSQVSETVRKSVENFWTNEINTIRIKHGSHSMYKKHIEQHGFNGVKPFPENM